MLARRPTTDLLEDEPQVTHDRSMLILQYLMAGVAVVAALLLAGVR
jgi:hypothetical protein